MIIGEIDNFPRTKVGLTEEKEKRPDNLPRAFVYVGCHVPNPMWRSMRIGRDRIVPMCIHMHIGCIDLSTCRLRMSYIQIEYLVEDSRPTDA